MLRYKIYEWLDPRTDKGVWTNKYNSFSFSEQAKADARILYLRDQPPSMWVSPQAKKLSSKNNSDCKDIYEIRFKAKNVQQRPLGFFGPDDDVFTIVLWATHKGKQWDPKEYCSIAKARYEDVKNGRVKNIEIKID